MISKVGLIPKNESKVNLNRPKSGHYYGQSLRKTSGLYVRLLQLLCLGLLINELIN